MDDYTTNSTRLIQISKSIKRLEKRMNEYLEQYQYTHEWRRFKEGLVEVNQNSNPQDIVNLRLCPVNSPQKSEFYPETKKIVVCYNLVADQESLYKEVNHQMTKFYDSCRAKINYGNCSQLVCSEIRGLNISKKCKGDNHNCFIEAMKHNLLETQVCLQKDINFKDIHSVCITDIAPFNTIKTMEFNMI